MMHNPFPLERVTFLRHASCGNRPPLDITEYKTAQVRLVSLKQNWTGWMCFARQCFDFYQVFFMSPKEITGMAAKGY
ncbi:MAG: hypothetical protein DIZ78_12975 [endosymbiont of Escarpia spicata]|uniref:Uncharacterized protein n=1 Tax=endosymbiont of Escarpia spicata TaxID=2200908 RepID=A0A370DGV1_9GAMM|nr:MAG: hypothetical protein DIZ78_12975 [endosymbiont of Escarpia spicata]